MTESADADPEPAADEHADALTGVVVARADGRIVALDDDAARALGVADAPPPESVHALVSDEDGTRLARLVHDAATRRRTGIGAFASRAGAPHPRVEARVTPAAATGDTDALATIRLSRSRALPAPLDGGRGVWSFFSLGDALRAFARGAESAATAGMKVASARADAVEARLRDLVDGIDGIVWEADARTFQFTFVSRRAETLLGYPVSDWIEDPTFWADHIHPLDRRQSVEYCHEETKGGRDHEFEYRMLAADGRVVWLRDYVYVVRDAAGKPRRLRGLMVDVTKRKMAEQRLALQHAVTSALASADTLDEAAPAILETVGEHLGWEIGGAWRVDDADESLHPVAGWRAHTIAEGSFDSTIHEYRFRKGEGLPGRVWAHREPAWVADVRHDGNFPRARQAAEADLRAGLAFPLTGGGRVLGVIEFFSRDERPPDAQLLELLSGLGHQIGQFIDRRRALEALRASEERTRAIVETSLDCIVSIDRDGRVLEFNSAAEATFGYPRAEALGREMSDLIVPPEYRERHRAGLRRVLQSGESRILGKRLELPAMRKDGSEFPTELAIVRLPGDGAATFTGFLRDVSEQKEAQETTARLLIEIEEQRRRLDNIIASVPGVVWEAWGGPDDTNQRIDFVSDHAEKMLGYSVDEWLSTPNFWLTVVHPDDRERAAAEARAKFERGGGTSQFRWVARDGRVLDVLAQSVVVYDAGGSPVGMRGVTTDITDRKRMEDALRYHTQLLGTIADNAASALFMMDERGRCTFMNAAAEAMTAFTLDEIRDVPLHDVIHSRRPDGRHYPMSECPIDRALPENRVCRDLEETFVRKNGELFPVICSAAPIFRDGRAVGTVIEVRDVTEEKRAHRALTESEERYRLLARNSTDLIARHAPDGTYQYASPASLALLGYAPEELVGVRAMDLVHPEDRPLAVGTRERILAASDSYTLTYRVRHKGGDYVWVESAARAVRDDATGDVVEIVSVTRDVTERKAAEEAVRESEARYRALAEALPVHVWTALPDGHLDYVNDRVLDYFGRDFDEMIGEGWTDVVHPEDLPGVIRKWSASLESGDSYEVEFRLRRHDGEYRWHIGRARAILDDDGRIVKWFGTNADITDRKLYEDALRGRAIELTRLAAALERKNRELDQFAYVTSHDLKAPLRGIANLSTWIEEDFGDGVPHDVRGHLDLLRGRVHRMESLINAILEYSRVGRVRQAPELVDVGALLREVVDLVSPPAAFTVDVPDELPTLVADRARLQQVFMNLIGNAVKHHDRDDGRVTLTVAAEADRYRFTVADDGPGIDARFHDKVFVIFQTLQPRDKVEGTGVGLALVKKIVESHGGTITLDSEEGAGAAFTFTWPKEPPKEETH